MGSIKLPQSQLSELPPIRKKTDNTEAILQVLGQNPFAQGLNQATPAITDALAKRAELRRQTEQVARAEQLAGEQPGTYANLDPAMANVYSLNKIKHQQDLAEALAKKQSEYYTIDQLNKINTGDLSQLPSVYPNGVPKEAVNLTSTIQNRKSLDIDRDLARQGIQERFGKRIGLDTTKAIQTEGERILNDDLVKSSIKTLDTFGQAQTVFNQDLSVARGAMQGLANRTINKEVGTSTEGDIERATGSRDLANKYGNYLRLMYDGRATDQDYREFQTLFKAIQERATQQYEQSMAVGVDSLTNAFRISPETSKTFLRYRPASTYISSQEQIPLVNNQRTAPGVRQPTQDVLTPEKRKRLQELRLKKSQGKL